MNLFSKGLAKCADVVVASGSVVHLKSASVARTDTSAKTLFTLPANAVVVGIGIYTATYSDAGTSATLSLGNLGGTGTEWVNALDVKGSTKVGVLASGTLGVYGTVGSSAISVTGTYAEVTASSQGGPYLVYFHYITRTPAKG